MTARNSRSAPLDSDATPLEGKRLMKFDPTFNTGTIVQIVVVIASAFAIYTGIKTDQVQTKADLDAVKASALVERTQTREALSELKADVKKQADTLSDIKESLAVLRGRSTDTGSKR